MRGDVVSNVLLIHVALYPWKGLEVDSERLRMRAHMSTNRAQLLKIARIRSKYSNTNICLRKKAFVADGISGFFGTRALSRNKHSRALGAPTGGAARYPADWSISRAVSACGLSFIGQLKSLGSCLSCSASASPQMMTFTVL